MTRHLFGWSYPPGAANDPFAPYNQTEGPCEVCGRDIDDCICPACPICEMGGNPACYEEHGMKLQPEQIASKAVTDAAWERERQEMQEAAAAEAEYWMNQQKEEKP